MNDRRRLEGREHVRDVMKPRHITFNEDVEVRIAAWRARRQVQDRNPGAFQRSGQIRSDKA